MESIPIDSRESFPLDDYTSYNILPKLVNGPEMTAEHIRNVLMEMIPEPPGVETVKATGDDD